MVEKAAGCGNKQIDAAPQFILLSLATSAADHDPVRL
jgi:hypothetical protein